MEQRTFHSSFHHPVAKMIAAEEEMKEARIPPAWRDTCAHILIKLNECRNENYYRMNKCEELRHEYEKCQYEEWQLRFGVNPSHKRREAEYERKHAENQSS